MFTRVALSFSVAVIAMWIGSVVYISLFPEDNMPNYVRDDGRVTIVATIYPLAYLAMDLDPVADVTTIVGPGIEPHEYEPTINDVKQMQDAEIFLFNGEVDEWAAQSIEDRRRGITIDVLRSLAVKDSESDAAVDPHVWLDPVYAEEIVRQIGQQLEYVDPIRADVIAQNVETKVAEIRGVDIAYRAALTNCLIPEIVTTHSAFSYLSKAYGFTAYSAMGLSPDEEPNAATISELVDLVRAHDVPTVFAETLVGDRLATTIANEADATVDTLNPIESLTPGYDESSGYTAIMMENLEKLKTAMVCMP